MTFLQSLGYTSCASVRPVGTTFYGAPCAVSAGAQYAGRSSCTCRLTHHHVRVCGGRGGLDDSLPSPRRTAQIHQRLLWLHCTQHSLCCMSSMLLSSSRRGRRRNAMHVVATPCYVLAVTKAVILLMSCTVSRYSSVHLLECFRTATFTIPRLIDVSADCGLYVDCSV